MRFHILENDPSLEKKWLKAITKPLKFYKTCKFKKVKKKEKKTVRTHKIQKIKKNKGSSNGGITIRNHEPILCEILSRVQVDSLMRLKCVCKSWRSLIAQDSNFINLHRTRSKPRLLIVVPKPIRRTHSDSGKTNTIGINTRTRDLCLTGDLDCQSRRASITTVCKTRSWIYNSISKPVNGLFCFIDSECLYAVRICNIGTREVTPWIQSTLIPKEEEKNNRYEWLCWYEGSFQLGFDPVTNEHKLVCLWYIDTKEDEANGYSLCEILTVGDNVWRRIEDVPPYEVQGETSIYVNGSIYWITISVMRLYLGFNNDHVCIVVFDVGSEKFRTITIPNFVLNEVRDHYKGYIIGMDEGSHLYADLLQVGCGRIAMLIRMTDYIVKLWIFDDNKDEIYSNWTEAMTIKLPFRWGGNNRVHFHTIEGIDDQIILRTYRRNMEDFTIEEDVSYYRYNWKENSFTKFKIRGIPSSIPNLISAKLFATFVETLSPVNHK